MNKIIDLFFLIFSGLLSLGTFDPVFFGTDLGITSLELSLMAFVVLYCFFYFKEFIFSFDLKIFSLFSVFCIFGVSQLIYGVSFSGLFYFNFKFLLCIFFCWATISYLKFNPKQIIRGLLVFSVFSALYAFFVVFVFNGAVEVYKGQMIVFGENPNSTSSRLAVAFVFLLAFCLQNPFNWNARRWFLIIAMLPIFWLIIRSGSRGSLLVVLVSALFLLVFSRIKPLIKILFVSASFAAVPVLFGYLLADADVASRWMSAAEGDTAGRSVIWQQAISIALDNPIFGVGEGGYFDQMQRVHGSFIDTHNLFIYIFVCGGLVATLFFSIFLVGLGYDSYFCLRYKEIFPTVCFLMVVLIAAKTGGAITYLLMWYVFSVVASYKYLIMVMNNEDSINSRLGRH